MSFTVHAWQILLQSEQSIYLKGERKVRGKRGMWREEGNRTQFGLLPMLLIHNGTRIQINGIRYNSFLLLNCILCIKSFSVFFPPHTSAPKVCHVITGVRSGSS